MATLHVRNIPEAAYEALRARARAHGRSINAETIAFLESLASHSERLSTFETLRVTAELRSRQPSRPGGPGVVELIRADRDR